MYNKKEWIENPIFVTCILPMRHSDILVLEIEVHNRYDYHCSQARILLAEKKDTVTNSGHPDTDLGKLWRPISIIKYDTFT